MTIQAQLRPLVERFVADVERHLRADLVEAVSRALGSPVATPVAVRPSKPVRNTSSRKNGPVAKSVAAPAAAPGRVRRSPVQLKAVQARIVGYVRANPGAKAEQIKSALGLTTATWLRPAKQLVDAGMLKTTGQKRATTYRAG